MFLRRLISARVLWRLLAVVLMLGSAFSFLRMIGDAATAGDWIGLPQYAAAIASVQRDAVRCEVAASVLPLIAALALSLALYSGRSANDRSSRVLNYFADLPWSRSTTIVAVFVLNVVVSFLGSGTSLVVIYLVAILISKAQARI